jgi:hypothetical protein
MASAGGPAPPSLTVTKKAADARARQTRPGIARHQRQTGIPIPVRPIAGSVTATAFLRARGRGAKRLGSTTARKPNIARKRRLALGGLGIKAEISVLNACEPWLLHVHVASMFFEPLRQFLVGRSDSAHRLPGVRVVEDLD